MSQATTGARTVEQAVTPWSYVAACGGGAALLCLVALTQLGAGDIGKLGYAFWLITALLVLSELRPVVASGAYDPAGVSLSTAPIFAILFHWGPWPAFLVQAVIMTLGEIARRKEAWRVIFNAGQYVLCLAVAWVVLRIFGLQPSPSHPAEVTAHVLPAMALAWVVHFLVNLALVAGALSRRNGTSWWEEFTEDFSYYAVTTFAVLVLSPVVVVLASTVWQLLPLLLLPMFLVYKTASISLDKEHAALHDGLTGLANRKLLIDETSRALDDARRDGRPLALCLLDLDRFKEINDTLGHHIGDRLLEIAGSRLAGAVRQGDTVARLGGDEFAVLLASIDGPAAALDAAQRIRELINEPFQLDGMTLQVEASVGVSLHPDHADETAQLLRLADVAMYQAKEARTGVEIYRPDRDIHTLGRLGLLGSLRRAVEDGELVMHYQPKVSFPSGEAVGMEALVRWRHPQRGLVMPDEFLGLAEQSGLMRQLTESVLAQSLSQAAAWWRQGLELQVAVNVSVRDLADVGFVDALSRLLAVHRLPARALQLEITEHVLMADPARMSQALEALARLGVSLSLDDFGTGYSSLVHLKRLPVSEIKIDRSFVHRMTDDADDAAIVRSIVELGHALGLRVVAEGVEDPGTWVALQALRCDAAQGWLISPAVPAEEITGWLLRRLEPRAGDNAARVH